MTAIQMKPFTMLLVNVAGCRWFYGYVFDTPVGQEETARHGNIKVSGIDPKRMAPILSFRILKSPQTRSAQMSGHYVLYGDSKTSWVLSMDLYAVARWVEALHYKL